MLELNIEAIVATDLQDGFAKEDKIPWTIQRDLRFFRDITVSTPDPKHLVNVVVMGRKTFEMIGKPLPGRINIILTRQKEYTLPPSSTKCYVCATLSEAYDICKSIENIYKVFVIGGEQVYIQAIKMWPVRRIYKTVVHQTYACDRYFPDISSCYRSIACSATEQEKDLEFHFELWEKKACNS